VVLRKLFERLGSTYVKLGQFIASSPSLFPDEYVLEFQKCLDKTEAVPYSAIQPIIEAELVRAMCSQAQAAVLWALLHARITIGQGRPLGEVFSSVDPVPLASASVAQVHTATLKSSNKQVVIKVLKPGVEDILSTDMSFVYLMSKYLEFIQPKLSRLSLTAIMGDIRTSMLEEVDFNKEADHIQQFSTFLDTRGFRGVATCPYVYRQFSSKRILVMERLVGAPLVDYAAIRSITSKDPEAVLVSALNTWFASVMGADTFHADVHAGNLLVLGDGRVGFLDFGIVGRISPVTWKAVEALVTSLALADYETMARALATIGACDVDVDYSKFARDLETFFTELEQVNTNVVVTRNGRSGAGRGVSASLEVDQTQLNRLFLNLVRIGETHGVRFPREFGLFLKQLLYFDRYTRILAPSLQMQTVLRRSSMATAEMCSKSPASLGHSESAAGPTSPASAHRPVPRPWLIDLQSDNANIADAYYGGRGVQQWYLQQTGSSETVHLSPISSPADWVATGPMRSLHACLATPISTPPEPTVHPGPAPTTPSQPGAQLGPTATTPFQPPPGPAATTPSQPGSQPVPVPSVVLSGPPGPLAPALSATMPPQVLARFLAYLANQQAIVDGSGGSSTTGVVGQQSGGSNPTGLVAAAPQAWRASSLVAVAPQLWWASSLVAAAPQAWRASSLVAVAPQLWWASSLVAAAPQAWRASSLVAVAPQLCTTTVVGQQPGGSSTTGLAGQQLGGSSTTTVVGQQPGGSSTTGLAGQPSSRSFAVTVLQMYNKRLQYGASAAQYLALLDPRYRRLSQHVTREQCKLAEQLLIKLATKDGCEGDRPAAEALSQLAIGQQPDVVLFSHTSLSAVYFAPQLTSDLCHLLLHVVQVLDGGWLNADVNGALHGRLLMACMTSLQP
ncbi:hypothetical protein QJQ45_024446, partial [Haematococcus lacustris]